MKLAQALRGVLPRSSSDRNLVRDGWDLFRSVPGGPRVFSQLIGRAAPYTGTIGAQVIELRSDYARVQMADRPRLRNHLGSIHAIALCNLAELTGNVTLAYALPDDGRFIIKSITIDYLKKARGTITGVCDHEMPRLADPAEFEIPVELSDEHGEPVVRATLHSLVGRKPGR